MIKLGIILFILALVAIIAGVSLFPKVSTLKIVLSVIGSTLLIGAIIFYLIFKAAHTLPEGAKPVEKNENGQLEVKDDDG